MKILCPQCKQPVPADQVNISTDLAFCPQCDEGFKISTSMDLDSINQEIVRHPPKGTWYREDMHGAVLGASTRSPAAFILVPFMCVWSGGSLGGIYGSQIANGKFDLGISLFGIPFLLGSILFWSLALMAIWGKVEITLRGTAGRVFVGIRSLGWKRDFDWGAVEFIREKASENQYPGGHEKGIILEGKEQVKFGSGLNDERRSFMVNALKLLQMQLRQRGNETL